MAGHGNFFLRSGKCFTGLCYSADGRCLVAGGKSRYVCIYELSQKVLLKKFRVSKNQSLDGISEKLNSKASCQLDCAIHSFTLLFMQFMTEAGPLQTIDHAEDSEEEGRYDLYLPGVAKGDLSSRRTRPEIQVKSVRFSPTGCSWAACTTEGLLIYSLGMPLPFNDFAPF
jgi:periodic tryptophan protein 2